MRCDAERRKAATDGSVSGRPGSPSGRAEGQHRTVGQSVDVQAESPRDLGIADRLGHRRPAVLPPHTNRKTAGGVSRPASGAGSRSSGCPARPTMATPAELTSDPGNSRPGTIARP